jgi:hypothetical protein
VELFGHAPEITNTVSIPIGERARVDLIKNRRLPPLKMTQNNLPEMKYHMGITLAMRENYRDRVGLLTKSFPPFPLAWEFLRVDYDARFNHMMTKPSSATHISVPNSLML